MRILWYAAEARRGLMRRWRREEAGAKTVLIERYGFLGGMSTSRLVYPWMTFHTMDGKQVIGGIAQEIVDRLMAMNASPGHVRDTVGFVHTITPYDPEVYKV